MTFSSPQRNAAPKCFCAWLQCRLPACHMARTIMAYPRGGSYTVANENLGVAGTTRRGVSDRAIEKLPLLER
jgi:hypothetical protein